jgi:hypothetical protein
LGERLAIAARPQSEDQNPLPDLAPAFIADIWPGAQKVARVAHLRKDVISLQAF